MACIDCSQEFTFTAGEQEFYAQKGFTEPPKRCTTCRATRKAQRGSTGAGYSSSSYGGSSTGGGYGNGGGGYSSEQSGGFGSYGSRGSYSSGGGGGGYSSGGGGGYGGERRPREMFDAVCANCGQAAQVPFQPTGSRPVYCSNCFQARRG